MNPPQPSQASLSQPLVYRIDSANRITFVNEAWCDFARANQSEQFLREQILGDNLLGSFDDPTVQELYGAIIRQVRAGRTVRFDYRCDVPDSRRTFAMEIHLRPDEEVEFVSTLLREEPRSRVALLQRGVERDKDRFIRMCSWCQGVAVPDGRWLPVEEAVAELKLMENEVLPHITHGMCQTCHERVNVVLGR